MKLRHLIFLTLFIPGVSAFVTGQDAQCSRIRREYIRAIDTSRGFESKVTLQSIPGLNRKNYYIHYTSLEKINDYEIRCLTDKSKWKLFRKAGIHDFQVTGH